MFHAWNAAQASGTPLLIVADTPPSECHVALPALASRLRAVPVLTIGEPDACLARDMMEARFARRGLALSHEVPPQIVAREEGSKTTCDGRVCRGGGKGVG